MQKMYRIVRTSGTLDDLVRLVDLAKADAWMESGAPFRDSEAREWCLAMTKPRPPAEARLREPKKK